MILSGWGGYPRVSVNRIPVRARDQAVRVVTGQASLIARGNGRAYGDAALNIAATADMTGYAGVLAFDAVGGRLTVAAGSLLADLLEFLVPRGWFVPVTPGTRFVTVGGMVAADVHGKNHHGAGSFGDHVESLELLLADGAAVRCGPRENSELFHATRGGMGLTGLILTVTFRLIPIETAAIRQETLRASSLDAVMDLFEQSRDWTYSVAWIDCLAQGRALGRSVLYRGEHASRAEVPAGHPAAWLEMPRRRLLRVPMNLPGFVLNRWTVRAFNEVQYRSSRPGLDLIALDRFFFPLDAILEWNRIYGRGGFVQYQCVLPKDAGAGGMRALLERIGRSGDGSFLAVLKLFGRQEGLLSFPMEGYTLALDFPATSRVFGMLIELDAIVAAHGGRHYLAKDARAGAAFIQRGYPRLDEFRALRARLGLDGKFSSVLSERLGL